MRRLVPKKGFGGSKRSRNGMVILNEYVVDPQTSVAKTSIYYATESGNQGVLNSYAVLAGSDGCEPQKGNTANCGPNSCAIQDTTEADSPDPILDDITFADENEQKEETPAGDFPNSAKSKKLSTWKTDHCSPFLDQLVFVEGRGGKKDFRCRLCRGAASDIFRCKDCFALPFLCTKCMLKQHRWNPFHRIEVWRLNFWEKASLFDLGLLCHIGHNGDECKKMYRGPVELTILHTSGFHKVRVRFCDCSTTKSCHQLLRQRLYPASYVDPQTAFTFDVLDHFTELACAGKVSAHDYYQSLVRVTDGSGLVHWPKRYDEFLLAVRTYLHLLSLKRGGRAHDPKGVENTSAGQLALECPSCPHPGKNLPRDWASAPTSESWLYGLVLAIDANFRLRLKDRGVAEDPQLDAGWAYFVDDESYQQEIRKHEDYVEGPSTCDSTFNAVEKATVSKDGFLATGVAAVVCARSGMIRGNGIADLRQGERYIYMDLLLLSTLVYSSSIRWLCISYDIGCQFSKNFESRLKRYPSIFQTFIAAISFLRFVVPKFHMMAHGLACQAPFSLNYLPFSARVDGEGIERNWSHMDALAPSSREMSPAHRRETINYHYSAYNWLKIVRAGDLLAKKLQDAVKQLVASKGQYDEFVQTLEKPLYDKWMKMINEYKENPLKARSPYHDPDTERVTLNDVKKALQREENSFEGSASSPFYNKAAEMLYKGLEIEEDQRTVSTLAALVARKKNISGLDEKRAGLRKKERVWRPNQLLLMPVVSTLLIDLPGQQSEGDADDNPTIHPEDTKLWLPSQLDADQRRSLRPEYDLVNKEARFRFAQLLDGLKQLRNLLSMRSNGLAFRKAHLSGQREYTRSREVMNQFNDRISKVKNRYRAAHEALSALAPHGFWKKVLKPLRDADIVSPDAFDITEPIEDDTMEGGEASRKRQKGRGTKKTKAGKGNAQLGQGKKNISWLWMAEVSMTEEDIFQDRPLSFTPSPFLPESANNISESSDNNDDPHTVVRISFARAEARWQRWKEELALVQEEMRRTLEYHNWKAAWWRSQAMARSNESEELRDGLAAYAEKQARIWEELAVRFAKQWGDLLSKNKLAANWPDKYKTFLPSVAIRSDDELAD